MKSTDSIIVAILLAVGAILQYFLQMLHTPLTPNIVIAFYCLAILLIKPKIYEALGIGLGAGILLLLIPGSVFPLANLISGPVGAYICWIFYEFFRQREFLAPVITTIGASLASDFTFVGITMLFVSEKILTIYQGNFLEFVAIYVPIVIITAVMNAAIVLMLYIPLSRVVQREWND